VQMEGGHMLREQESVKSVLAKVIISPKVGAKHGAPTPKTLLQERRGGGIRSCSCSN